MDLNNIMPKHNLSPESSIPHMELLPSELPGILLIYEYYL